MTTNRPALLAAVSLLSLLLGPRNYDETLFNLQTLGFRPRHFGRGSGGGSRDFSGSDRLPRRRDRRSRLQTDAIDNPRGDNRSQVFTSGQPPLSSGRNASSGAIVETNSNTSHSDCDAAGDFTR